MKKINVYRLAIIIFFIYTCFLIFIFTNKYFKLQNSLDHFAFFYSKDELDILEDDITPIQKKLYSENYIVSLKGVWAQENCINVIMEIQEKDGKMVSEKEIKCFVENTAEVDEVNGNRTFVGQEYKESIEGNSILGIKCLSDKKFENVNVKIDIKEEQFVFVIPITQNENLKHFISTENANTLVSRKIYLSPMSLCVISENSTEKAINMSEVGINIGYINGTTEQIDLSGDFISSEDNNGKQIYLRFLNRIYDTAQIETISVGNTKYKNER